MIPYKAEAKLYNPCNCVSYARYVTGWNVGSIGVARNHPITSRIPLIGAIVVTTDGHKTGHLAVITAITETHIAVKEANYQHCRVSERLIPLDSRSIRGYYYQF